MTSPSDDLYVCLEFPDEDSDDGFGEPVQIVMTVSGRYGATVFDALRSHKLYCLDDPAEDRYLSPAQLQFLEVCGMNPVQSQFTAFSVWRTNACLEYNAKIRREHEKAAEERAGSTADAEGHPRRRLLGGPSALRAVAW